MKTTMQLFATFALGCVLATHQANGDIIVEFKSALPGSSFTLSEIVPTDGSGAAVSFPIPNANTGTWRIYSDNPAVDSINTISFTGAVNRDIKLVIGRPGVDYNPFIDPGAPALVHWIGGVSAGGAIIDVQASVSGAIGAVVANRVARLKAGQGIAGNIASTSTSTSDTMVRIEAPTIAPLLGGADPVISSSGGNIQTIVVTGDMSASVSASSTAAINTIDVGGRMQGDVSTVSGNIGTVRIGDWYVGLITSASGTFILLQTENGGFGGSISVGGSVQSLDVAGDIGIVQTASGTFFIPTTISTTNGANMGSLSAGGAFIADISAAGNISSITAGLSLSNASVVNGQLVSETGIVSAANGTIGSVSVGTFIDADISTNTITNALDTGGDYSRGALTLSQPLAAGSQIRVGGSLASNASIQTPVAGLAGQIIINKGNAGGAWQGVVKIGPNGDPGQIVLDGAASVARRDGGDGFATALAAAPSARSCRIVRLARGGVARFGGIRAVFGDGAQPRTTPSMGTHPSIGSHTDGCVASFAACASPPSPPPRMIGCSCGFGLLRLRSEPTTWRPLSLRHGLSQRPTRQVVDRRAKWPYF